MSHAHPALSEERIRELLYRVQHLGDREAALELQRASKRKAHRDTQLAARLNSVLLPEWQEQATLAARLDADPRFEGRWFHAPNGEARNARTGAKLKKMGVKKGVPDIFIWRPFAFGGRRRCALVIELKKLIDGAVSDEQSRWGDVFEECGAIWVPAYGWRDAWQTIEAFYDDPE